MCFVVLELICKIQISISFFLDIVCNGIFEIFITQLANYVENPGILHK